MAGLVLPTILVTWSLLLVGLGLRMLLETTRSASRRGSPRVAALPWAGLLLAGMAALVRQALGDGPLPQWMFPLAVALVLAIAAMVAGVPRRDRPER